MRNRNRITVAALLLAPLTLALAGCKNVPGSNTSVNPDGTVTDCKSYPVQPAVTLDNSGTPVVQTYTESYCDGPGPKDLKVEVRMDRLSADGQLWSPAGGINGFFNVCTDIPDPLGVKCAFTVRPCKDGIYRTRVHITGTSGNGDPIDKELNDAGGQRAPRVELTTWTTACRGTPGNGAWCCAASRRRARRTVANR